MVYTISPHRYTVIYLTSAPLPNDLVIASFPTAVNKEAMDTFVCETLSPRKTLKIQIVIEKRGHASL